jgi:nucleoside-diphosphate-sugar epimerase
MTRRVLVTGATGFVGRHSLPALVERGFDVHAVHSTGTPDAPATWHRADLLDREQLARLLDEARPTHLLHFAWNVEHGKFWNSTENLRWVESSLTLLREFAGRGGTRVVVAGTCAEYDWRHGFCSEQATPTVPATLYGTCKNALHAMAARFAANAGISLAWGRIFLPYGPREQERRLVPSVARSLQKGEPVQCSHGRQYRDFLHAQDCGEAFAALLDSPVEGPVNIASGRPVAIAEVVRTIASLVPGGEGVPIEFGAIPTPPDDPPLLVADVRRLTTEVGWAPRFGLREGLAQTLASMGVPTSARNLQEGP